MNRDSISYTVPGTSEVLFATERELRSLEDRLIFPIIGGVPVLFPLGAQPTFDAYVSSQEAADPADEWQIETLAIDFDLQEQVRKLVRSGEARTVDPAVNYLVLATNGLAYQSSLGQLDKYPIPELPLPSTDGARFLDIGCSWGRWCASAAKRGYRVHGIDPSLGAVLAARRMFRQLGLEGSFACGDGRALPFPDKSFDIVYSYSVLQHFSDEHADAAWSEIGRVLKPNGIALVQMANALGFRSLIHLMRRRFRRPQVFEVRYRLPFQLKSFGKRHVGPTDLTIDCFLGLGLQASDQHLYRGPARVAVKVSELLKRVGRTMSPLKFLADSLFVRSVKRDSKRAGGS